MNKFQQQLYACVLALVLHKREYCFCLSIIPHKFHLDASSILFFLDVGHTEITSTWECVHEESYTLWNRCNCCFLCDSGLHWLCGLWKLFPWKLPYWLRFLWTVLANWHWQYLHCNSPRWCLPGKISPIPTLLCCLIVHSKLLDTHKNDLLLSLVQQMIGPAVNFNFD